MTDFSAETIAGIRSLTLEQVIKYWDELEAHGRKTKTLPGVVRALCRADLFYLLVRVCRRMDMLHPWVYARCREVEADPDNHLDLWSRGHFKSSIGTFGLTIQKILKNPEITVGIFSHTRPIAKAFLRQIMREFESNKVLHGAFPDILWGDDTRSSPKWSEDDGIIVRRKSNPPEATIEAWGLVDGQPVSKHYQDLLYDDIVVEGSVSTPEMIEKTKKGLQQSYNLCNEKFSRRFYGTHWHFNDAYKTVKDSGTAIPRVHPATDDGTEYGKPVFWTDEMLQQKRRDMGPYVFAAQCLLNPKADSMQGFKREWLRYYKRLSPRGMNGYILVDSANSKRKESDYTSMWAVLLGTDLNMYAHIMVRDRLNLTERVDRLFTMHRKLRAEGVNIIQVRWERYGMMADIEAIKTEQEKQNYRFDITEVAGQTSKDDRIKRLIPIFEQGHFYLPETMHITDWQKNVVDLVQSFVEEEYFPFPVGLHRDMLDSLARIAEPDLKIVWPMEAKKVSEKPVFRAQNPATAWMA